MKLDADFYLKRYGVEVRLVNEEDASFILKLRTNEVLNQHIHSVDDNLEVQKKWIRDYKKRESMGTDYYFIYHHDNIPIGVNRICNITDSSGTGASQVCEPKLSFELPLITVLLNREIFFELLNLPLDIFDVRKKNVKVQKMHKLFGAKKMEETELDVKFSLKKQDYLKNKPLFMQAININHTI